MNSKEDQRPEMCASCVGVADLGGRWTSIPFPRPSSRSLLAWPLGSATGAVVLACALLMALPSPSIAFPADIIKSVEVIGGAEIGFPLNNADRFGISVEWLGDLDGDGRPEVGVGAHLDDEPFDSGAAYVFSLDVDGTVLPGSVVKYSEPTDPVTASQVAARCSVAGTSECNLRDLFLLNQAIQTATPVERHCDAAFSPPP